MFWNVCYVYISHYSLFIFHISHWKKHSSMLCIKYLYMYDSSSCFQMLDDDSYMSKCYICKMFVHVYHTSRIGMIHVYRLLHIVESLYPYQIFVINFNLITFCDWFSLHSRKFLHLTCKIISKTPTLHHTISIQRNLSETPLSNLLIRYISIQ